MMDIDLEHPAIRLHLAPYERWASEFRFHGPYMRVGGAFYRDGVEPRQPLSMRGTPPTTRASLSLAVEELAAVSTPEETVTVHTSHMVEGASTHEWSVSQLPAQFARLLSRVDPERTFELTTLPPVRSPAAHAEVREHVASRREHARAAVERMSPPVEALVPIETSHRVLAVEPIEQVRERGEPTKASVWEHYRDQLRPGECLGVHLTQEMDSKALRRLRLHGFDRRWATTPPAGREDTIRWNVLHVWVHAPDIGTWGGLWDWHAVVMALPQAYTYVGQFALADEWEAYETDYVVRFPEYASTLAETPTALAESHTPASLLG